MVASHADSDHIGGLISVLQAPDISVHQVLYNGYPGDTTTWTRFAAAAAADDLALTPIQYLQELAWGLMDAHVLNPSSGLSNPETNQASLVIRVDTGTVNYLFTGDIDSTIEATVVARGTPLASEILKVAHHGSAYSSSTGFLAAADPQAAIISVGTNSYGHPSPETISRLLAAGAVVGRTDELGTILVTSNGTTYSISPALSPPSETYLPWLSQSAE
ncbi:MAG: hypothetical protein M1281_10485 [Chloroflexi bacterium]|nr:hypothetical protein [Chloroflexota bacterium]